MTSHKPTVLVVAEVDDSSISSSVSSITPSSLITFVTMQFVEFPIANHKSTSGRRQSRLVSRQAKMMANDWLEVYQSAATVSTRMFSELNSLHYTGVGSIY